MKNVLFWHLLLTASIAHPYAQQNESEQKKDAPQRQSSKNSPRLTLQKLYAILGSAGLFASYTIHRHLGSTPSARPTPTTPLVPSIASPEHSARPIPLLLLERSPLLADSLQAVPRLQAAPQLDTPAPEIFREKTGVLGKNFAPHFNSLKLSMALRQQQLSVQPTPPPVPPRRLSSPESFTAPPAPLLLEAASPPKTEHLLLAAPLQQTEQTDEPLQPDAQQFLAASPLTIPLLNPLPVPSLATSPDSPKVDSPHSAPGSPSSASNSSSDPGSDSDGEQSFPRTNDDSLFNALYAAAENACGVPLTERDEVMQIHNQQCVGIIHVNRKKLVTDFINQIIRGKKIPCTNDRTLLWIQKNSDFQRLCALIIPQKGSPNFAEKFRAQKLKVSFANIFKRAKTAPARLEKQGISEEELLDLVMAFEKQQRSRDDLQHVINGFLANNKKSVVMYAVAQRLALDERKKIFFLTNAMRLLVNAQMPSLGTLPSDLRRTIRLHETNIWHFGNALTVTDALLAKTPDNKQLLHEKQRLALIILNEQRAHCKAFIELETVRLFCTSYSLQEALKILGSHLYSGELCRAQRRHTI